MGSASHGQRQKDRQSPFDDTIPDAELTIRKCTLDEPHNATGRLESGQYAIGSRSSNLEHASK